MGPKTAEVQVCHNPYIAHGHHPLTRMGRRIAKGDKYEREIIDLVMERTDFYGQRGTHTDGVDCIFYRRGDDPFLARAFRAEIKSSHGPKRYFSRDAKLIRQYEGYRRILDEYGVMTFYFMRLVGGASCLEGPDGATVEMTRPESRWRVFRIDRMPVTPGGAPYLDFFHEYAITLEDFIEFITG